MHSLIRLMLCFIVASTLACSDAISADDSANDDEFNFDEPTPPEIPVCANGEGIEYPSHARTQFEHEFLSPTGPHCIRSEDGFGGSEKYCDEIGLSGPIEEFYPFCQNPYIGFEQNSMEATRRETPCIWWPIEIVDESGACGFDMACVPEDRLTEIGWPEGVKFEFHKQIFDEQYHCHQRPDETVD